MQFGDNNRYGGDNFRQRERRFGGNEDGFARPVKMGEELDVTIEAVGEKGDGVAKKNGFVIFVPGVQQGDNVRVKITKVFRKMAFAEVVGKAEGKAPTEEEPADEDLQMDEEEVEEESEGDSEEF